MSRTISPFAFTAYSQPSSPAQSQQRPSSGGTAPSYVSPVSKLVTSPGGITGTGIAEGYNKAYDFATGWEGAPGTNLATGTKSSGTFGGSNVGNVAAGYAGGKIAGELFDGRGYSELAGSLGASLGYATALGGTAIGAQAGATFGAFAGPVGAIAGAVLGGALGSVMGGGSEDYRFRTYSGELGDSHSSINTERASQAASDRALIKARDPSMEAWRTDYKAKPIKAYNDFQIGNTFDWAQEINAKTIDKNYASFDGPFGSYTVGHIDDLSDKGKFAKQWVSSIEQLDKAVSGLLTAEEIAMAKEGLSGSVQASREWHNKAGAALATNNMIADRYAQIFQLAGRDDLYQQLVDGMERTTEANKENGGRANAAEVLAQMLGGQQQAGGAGQFRVTRESPTAPTFRSRGLLGGGITRPQGEILPAMRAQYV